MYFAQKLNKQGDNIQSWGGTPSPILNQSIVLCLVLTVASWPAYRFLRRQVRWSGISISWRIFHCREPVDDIKINWFLPSLCPSLKELLHGCSQKAAKSLQSCPTLCDPKWHKITFSLLLSPSYRWNWSKNTKTSSKGCPWRFWNSCRKPWKGRLVKTAITALPLPWWPQTLEN